MIIKFISPLMSLRPMDSDYKKLMSPPISILTLAAMTPKHHKILLDDENVRPINDDDPVDLVAMTVNVVTAPRAYAIADRFRQKGIKVILGGIHPSVLQEEALNHADAVCVGETESLWEQILSDVETNQLQKVYFNPQPTDLSIVPPYRLDFWNQEDYLYTNTLWTSRGCPFVCDFCYNSADHVHKKFRNKPIENVLQEINRLKTKHVMFIDDNFIGNPTWTNEFLDAIKPLNLKWNAAVSTNIGQHKALLDKMRQTGCQSLFIGFETVNEEALKSVNKRQNDVKYYEDTIKEIHDRGIMVNASLAFGFDHDTTDVFPSTLLWLLDNKIETITAHILTPYPGTKLFEKLASENRIITKDWSKYNTANVVFTPKNMTPQELLAGYLWIYDMFYSYENIYKRLPEKTDQWKSYLLFNFAYRKYGNLTSRAAKLVGMNRFGRWARKIAYGIC